MSIVSIVLCVFAGILIYRVFNLQIVDGQTYLDDFQLKIEKERTLASTRGNIYDKNGNLLAYNELAYSVTIEDVYESGRYKNRNINATLHTVIQMIEKTLGIKFPKLYIEFITHHNNAYLKKDSFNYFDQNANLLTQSSIAFDDITDMLGHV